MCDMDISFDEGFECDTETISDDGYESDMETISDDGYDYDMGAVSDVEDIVESDSNSYENLDFESDMSEGLDNYVEAEDWMTIEGYEELIEDANAEDLEFLQGLREGLVSGTIPIKDSLDIEEDAPKVLTRGDVLELQDNTEYEDFIENVENLQTDINDYQEESRETEDWMTVEGIEELIEDANAEDLEFLQGLREGLISGEILAEDGSDIKEDWMTVESLEEFLEDEIEVESLGELQEESALGEISIEDNGWEKEDIEEIEDANADESMEVEEPIEDYEDVEKENEVVEHIQEEEFFEEAEEINSFENETEEMEINYDEIYEEIQQEALEQSFAEIDIDSDPERLEEALNGFEEATWETLSLDDQKETMKELYDYVTECVGFDNPPKIEYYNNEREGDYGGYNSATNTLSINEYMLYNSTEAADTIAHELWHAHQHECAMNPKNARDYQYQYNFENYITPDLGQKEYELQLVEAEARAFAAQFKERLSEIRGRR